MKHDIFSQINSSKMNFIQFHFPGTGSSVIFHPRDSQNLQIK